MTWEEVRQRFPNEWLVVEAIEAESENAHRYIHRMAVVEICPDSPSVMASYRRLHLQFPDREFYFLHTSREQLTIRERFWVRLRPYRNTDLSLDQLVAQITDENQHNYVDTGPSIGNEYW
jgi:hypothetical protein